MASPATRFPPGPPGPPGRPSIPPPGPPAGMQPPVQNFPPNPATSGPPSGPPQSGTFGVPSGMRPIPSSMPPPQAQTMGHPSTQPNRQSGSGVSPPFPPQGLPQQQNPGAPAGGPIPRGPPPPGVRPLPGTSQMPHRQQPYQQQKELESPRPAATGGAPSPMYRGQPRSDEVAGTVPRHVQSSLAHQMQQQQHHGTPTGAAGTGGVPSQQFMPIAPTVEGKPSRPTSAPAQQETESVRRSPGSRVERKDIAYPNQPPARFRVRERGKINEDDRGDNFLDDLSPDGGLQTFQRMVVLNEDGDLGAWTGFGWKSKRLPSEFFLRIAHDIDGRLWAITERHTVGKLTMSGFRSLGSLGEEPLIDLAFDPKDNTLWGVSSTTTYAEDFIVDGYAQFDRRGNLWAVNTACGLAVWEEAAQQWNLKDVPGNIRLHTLAFDEVNRLWIIGRQGELLVLAGSKWVNYGWVACWRLRDISFRWSKEAIEKLRSRRPTGTMMKFNSKKREVSPPSGPAPPPSSVSPRVSPPAGGGISPFSPRAGVKP